MTDQERINENLQRQIDAQTARIDNVLTKVDMLIIESQQQREDIRRAQEKHDADIKEMNQRFYQKFDDIDKKMDDKFDKLSSQMQTMALTTILGVGAIVWTIVSAFK